MYIKREVKIVITDEEKEILKKARDILSNFESESSAQDEELLQEMYDAYADCVYYQGALPTAVDLLTTIVGENGDEI